MNRWKSLIYQVAIVVSELLVFAALPLTVFARLAYSLTPWPRASIWTGTPILTLSRKAAAERLLGVRAISVVRRSYYITNDFDIDLNRIARGQVFLGFAMGYAIFLWSCVVAKRVHTFADGGLLPGRQRWMFSSFELLVYRLLKIKHFVWVYGADIRTREKTQQMGAPNCCTDCTQVKLACICDESLARRNMQKLQAGAVAIFSMGDMIEYTEGSNNTLFYWPLNLDADNGARYQPTLPAAQGHQPLRVVHAPNHRMFKGTHHIETAVANLQAAGVAIELVLVEKVPNARALDIYRTADIVFDQCMIGFHGYFALEAMALGKPVMCFVRNPKAYLLAPQECPIINITLASLEQQLRFYAEEGRGQLRDIGLRGRHYIERHYTEQAFSNRLQKAYSELGIES